MIITSARLTCYLLCLHDGAIAGPFLKTVARSDDSDRTCLPSELRRPKLIPLSFTEPTTPIQRTMVK